MASDYFAPAFRVVINGRSLAADLSSNITQVSVASEPDTLDSFQLTVANPYPEMRWTHNAQDAALFSEGNAIKIEMGYVDKMQTMFDGEITAISPDFPESGTPTLGVEGYTRMHWLKGTPHTRTFQNVTDKQIAERIAQEVGLTPRVDATSTTYPYVLQYNQTDLSFLVERGRDIHFELFVDGKTLVFRKVENDEGKTHTLVWGESLKSFQPKLDTLRQVSTVIVRGGADLKDKTKQIEGRAVAADLRTKMGGKKSGPAVAAAAFGKRKEEIIVDQPVESQEEADALAKSILEMRALEFITGSGSCIGIPELRAGSVVEIKGLGPDFSGLYYITQSTHTISTAGYETSFQVRRNAI